MGRYIYSQVSLSNEVNLAPVLLVALIAYQLNWTRFFQWKASDCQIT